ncbi:MAG: hypothetical protein M3R35_01420 [Candidatus Eremiobacteraeota bacterium]|nr:hypothetical protein [Candidatus Eremiobacteraeota bacterium]
MKRSTMAVILGLALLAGCASHNKYEKEADKLTRAVVANDMSAVASDFAPRMQGQITRVRVAQLSDELNAQGAYKGLKENDASCPPAAHCFDVTFAKSSYREELSLDDNNKVTGWRVHAGAPGTPIQ